MRVKVLTVRQPWAWAIVNGLKPIENRAWSTAHRGLLVIHSALNVAKATDLDGGRFPDGTPVPDPRTLDLGALVGVVNLTACVRLRDLAFTGDPAWRSKAQPWSTGPWCWLLDRPRRFKVPPVGPQFKGRLYLWDADVPDEVLKRAEEVTP
jgi:hypothetical protein